MARSLVVNHQEEASTNPLLTGFLVIAVAWMFIAAIAGGTTATADVVPVPVSAATGF